MEGRRAGRGGGEYGDERAASPHFVVGRLRLLALVSLSAARLVSAFAASQFFVIAGLLHKRSAQSGSIWQRYRCSKFDKWHLRSSSSQFFEGQGREASLHPSTNTAKATDGYGRLSRAAGRG